MRGIELMLMGIYTAMQNWTNYTDGRPPEINGELDLRKVDVSLADDNLKHRDNSMPTEITVTTWQHMPYSGLTCVNGTCKGQGYAFDVLRLIQSKLNFTYTIIPPESMTLGDNETGMMGLLYNKRVDVAVAFIPMLPDLNDLCSFSSIMDTVEITFLMARPRESATGSGLLAPFDNFVWICILISLIAVGPIVYILIFIRSTISSEGKRERYSFSTCLWFVYGALLKQGTTTAPTTDTTRLLFATWWIFITILTSFYTANLTAFLTLSEFTLPFKKIEDVVDGHHKWISLRQHTVDHALKREHSGNLDALKPSMERGEGDFISKDDDYHSILNYVDKGRIFLGGRSFIRSMIFDDYEEKTRRGMEESARCTYVMLPENIYTLNRAFAYRKNSRIEKHFNHHLMYLAETGFVKHLKAQDLPSVKICPLNLKSMERRLRNTDLMMTYKVVGAGFIVAIAVFLGEMIYRFCQMSKERFNCGKCCDSLCCRIKIKSAELPIYSVDPRPEFLKRKPSSIDGSLHSQQSAKKHFINGRDYWVIKENDGDRRLVPIRTPSALLFPYTT